MVKKSSTDREVGRKASRTRKMRAARQQVSTTRQVRWVESDEPLINLGHGVRFLHDELLEPVCAVAFLDGFDWRDGGAATVRLLGICPSFITAITADHWSEIIESTREAVLVFLSNEDNLNYAFRHGFLDGCPKTFLESPM